MMLIKLQMMKIAVVKRFQEGRKYVGTTIEGTASYFHTKAICKAHIDSAEKLDAMKDIPSNVNG